MAIMTVYGDPEGAVIQDSSIDEYYKGWYYFGMTEGGQDTYARLGEGKEVLLSVVYSAEGGDYGSPCYYNIMKNQQWYFENSEHSYELAAKVAAFLKDNGIKPMEF